MRKGYGLRTHTKSYIDVITTGLGQLRSATWECVCHWYATAEQTFEQPVDWIPAVMCQTTPILGHEGVGISSLVSL